MVLFLQLSRIASLFHILSLELYISKLIIDKLKFSLLFKNHGEKYANSFFYNGK